jgi:hypothetical protein
MGGNAAHTGEGVMSVAMAGEHEDVHGDQAREPDDHQS